MTPQPEWWAGLTADPAVRALGVAWRSPEDWEALEDSGPSDGTMTNTAFRGLHTAACEGKYLVGMGPGITRRFMGIDTVACWYLDPAKPDVLWCALDQSYAGWLWVPVGPTVDGIAEVLSSSHPTPALRRTELTSFARGFLGFYGQVELPNVYSGEFVDFNGHDLDRYMTMVHYTEVDSWGSSHLEDPMADDVEPVSPLVMSAFKRQNQTSAQLLGRIPSMTWRTLHSRSYVSFEVHQRDIVCAAVHYRPSPASHRNVVAQLRQETGIDYPVDLPLDVIGTLGGFGFSREQDLIGNLDDPETPDHLMGSMRVLAALWSGNLRHTLRLRRFAADTDPEVRMALARIANWYGYRFLFEDLALTETDPGLLERFECLQVTLGSDGGDRYNAFGDYFSGSPIMVDYNGDAVEVEHPEAWDDDEDEDEA